MSTRPTGFAPHLFVKDTEGAIAFYTKVFGAHELWRNRLPDGTILFVELALGDHRLLISEETPSLDALAPPTIGGSPVQLHLEVEDVDRVYRLARWAGATEEIPLQEAFWGERFCAFRDPFGHRWAVSTGREGLSPEEIYARTPPEV